MHSKWIRGVALALGLSLDWSAASSLAHAHHGMDDAGPESLADALRLGVEHPLLGVAQLALLLLLGWLSVRVWRRVRARRKASALLQAATHATWLGGCLWLSANYL